MRYSLFTLITLLALSASVMAQESKRVEITATYRPEVAPATKHVAPAHIDDAPSLDLELDYDVRPETWSIELEDYNFDAATATYWDYNRAKPFYLRVGAGAPLGSDLCLRYATHNSRLGYFGIGIEHDGDFISRSNVQGVERPIERSYDMRNGIAIHGGVNAGRQMFELSLTGDYDIYNRYAELAEVPFRSHLLNSALNLRYGDDFSDLSRLNFAVEVHGNYWAHPTPMHGDVQLMFGEGSVGGSLEFARAFGGNEVGINLGYDMWAGNATLNYRDVSFGGGVEYARRFGIVDLELGVEYLYDKVRGMERASHFVLPHARLLIDLKKAAFAPYIEFDTDVRHNNPSALYAKNPYIDEDTTFSTLPNTRSYAVTAGFAGRLSAARFAYRAYVGGEFMSNYLFWYVPTPGLFGVEAAANNRLRFGAELEYRPVGDLLFAVGYHHHFDYHDEGYVSCEPRFVVDALVEYRLSRFTLYVMSDIIGRREWRDMSREDGLYATPAKVDLRAGISFRASHGFEIYVDGYNLLNRTGDTAIYDYAYYYRNGIGFMAGIKLSF